jgi:hypothetical protein
VAGLGRRFQRKGSPGAEVQAPPPLANARVRLRKARTALGALEPLGKGFRAPAGLVTSISAAGNGNLKKYKKRLLLKGINSLDKRGEVAKLYRTMRAELLDMLGPEEDVTPTQRHLVEIITRGLVYLGHVDATLLEKVSLTNGTKRKSLPLLVERMSMSKIVSSQLQLLGLEKRTRVRSLQEDLAASPELLTKDGTPIPEEDKA